MSETINKIMQFKKYFNGKYENKIQQKKDVKIHKLTYKEEET